MAIGGIRLRIPTFIWSVFALASCGANQVYTGQGLSPDTDGDGIVDADDTCPAAPEDLDGHQDEDGCPDCDLDIEWVACVFEEGAGSCPGATAEDHDGDGIANEFDLCPEIPEDDDGFEEEDGCPDADNDADGITDEHDRCPNDAGPLSSGGCPSFP